MNDAEANEPKDYPLVQIPGYMEWSQRKIRDGESEALIAHLDATAMWLAPDELDTVSQDEFEDMLDDLKVTLEIHNREDGDES